MWCPVVYTAVEVLIHAAPAGVGSGDGELSPPSPLGYSLTQCTVKKTIKNLRQCSTHSSLVKMGHFSILRLNKDKTKAIVFLETGKND